MKHHLLISASLLLLAPLCLATPSPETKEQLTQLQQSLDSIIQHSALDPQTTQALIETTNDLTLLAENSNQRELNDLEAATHYNCLFESSSTFLKAALGSSSNTLITSLKCSARSNTLQKLIMSATKGQLSEEQLYTNPYIESFGYICNEWFFNNLLHMILPTLIKSSSTKTASKATVSSTSVTPQSIMIRILSGIAAHCAWLLQKKFLNTNTPALAKTIGIITR